MVLLIQRYYSGSVGYFPIFVDRSVVLVVLVWLSLPFFEPRFWEGHSGWWSLTTY